MKLKKILAMCLTVVMITSVNISAQPIEATDGYVFEKGFETTTIVDGMLGEDAPEDAVYIQEHADFAKFYNQNIANGTTDIVTYDNSSLVPMDPKFVTWDWSEPVYRQNIEDAAAFMPGYVFESVYDYLCVKIGVEDCEKAPTLGVYQILDSGTMEYKYGYVLSTVDGTTDVYEMERALDTTKGGKYVFVLAGGSNWKFASIKISFKEITEYNL